jgi:hypothetical protein
MADVALYHAKGKEGQWLKLLHRSFEIFLFKYHKLLVINQILQERKC